jgi:hypothetical protein
MLRRILRILPLLAVLPAWAWAGPPYETDDPEPADLGRLEVFVAAFASAEPGGSIGGGPQLQLNYGAAKDLQLSVAPQLSYSAPGAGPATYGLGDTQVGAKFRFLREDDHCPQAAIFPQVVLPSGDAKRGLGAGAAQVLLPLWLQKSWGPWTSFGGGGYWINPGAGNRNWTFLGAALLRDLGESVTVGMEWFYHSAAKVDDIDGLGSNLGLEWNFGPDRSLVFSAGRDLVWGNTTFTGFAAYRLVI